MPYPLEGPDFDERKAALQFADPEDARNALVVAAWRATGGEPPQAAYDVPDPSTPPVSPYTSEAAMALQNLLAQTSPTMPGMATPGAAAMATEAAVDPHAAEVRRKLARKLLRQRRGEPNINPVVQYGAVVLALAGIGVIFWKNR